MNNNELILGDGVPFTDYVPPSWDEWFIKMMYLVAQKSKDPKTKIGAVIVKDNRPICSGYNGICIGVDDTIPERSVRPAKYSWYEHGERNAIFMAAKLGIPTNGALMYTNGVPCIDCARAIIQSGIKRIIVHKYFENMSASAARQKSDQSQWKGHNDVSLQMFKEAKIKLDVYDKAVGSFAYFDGLRYIV